MRIEVKQAFGYDGKYWHPFGMPYPPCEKREPSRYLSVPKDISEEAARYAIEAGAAVEVADAPVAHKKEIETPPGGEGDESIPGGEVETKPTKHSKVGKP